MADGMLSLSWNNHSTTFSHTLAALRHKDKYTDATVACEGKFYPVHQLVLSTCSRYFEEMFEHTGAKHPVVLLQDVRQYELEALLSYMYAGIVSVAQRDLSRLIKVAELLQIKGLAVPDELPGEKKTVKNSHNSSSRDSLSPKSKVLHGGESSDDRSSPHPKRRRKEDCESSSRAKPSLPQTPDSPHIPSLDRSLENSKSNYSSHEQDLDKLSKDTSATESSVVEHRDQLNLSQDVRAAQQRMEVNDASYHSQDSSKSQYREKESEDAIVIKEEVWDEQRDSEVGVLSEDDRGRHDDPSAATNPALLVPKEYQEELTGHQLPPTLPTTIEALAGPSGMHQWLGGGDFSGGSENYGADNLGSPPPTDASQPHLTPQMMRLPGLLHILRACRAEDEGAAVAVNPAIHALKDPPAPPAYPGDEPPMPSPFIEKSGFSNRPAPFSKESSFSNVTFKVMEEGSKRNAVKLVDSLGYTYNVKMRRGNSTYWQCTVRPKVNPCKATVTERNGMFKQTNYFHDHLPSPKFMQAL